MVKLTTVYITHDPSVIFFGSIPVKGTAKALAVDLLKINPENVRRAPPLFLYESRFQTVVLYFSRKLASLVWLDHVNKTSSFHFVHLIDSFPSRSKSTHAKIYFKRAVSFRIFAD